MCTQQSQKIKIHFENPIKYGIAPFVDGQSAIHSWAAMRRRESKTKCWSGLHDGKEQSAIWHSLQCLGYGQTPW